MHDLGDLIKGRRGSDTCSMASILLWALWEEPSMACVLILSNGITTALQVAANFLTR